MTAEGVPFMQAGEEILRTKVKEDGSFDSNSYSSGDEVNSLKWETLDDPKYQENYEFYKGLIAFRKEHPLLRLTSGDEVAARVTAVSDLDKNVLAFTMDNTDKAVEGETAEQIFLAFNPNDAATTITLPEGNWNCCVKGTKAGTEVIETVSGTLTVDPVSAVVLVKGENKGTASTNAPLLPIAAGVAGLIAIVGGIFVVLKRKKK